MLAACGGPVSQERLARYVRKESHGLYQVDKLGPFDVVVAYRPTDLLVAQSLPNNTEVPPADSLIEQYRKQYGKYHYFNLTVSYKGQEVTSAGVTSLDEFGRRLQALSFRLNQYIKVISSEQDTVPVADFSAPRFFGTGGGNQFLVAFSREDLTTDGYIDFCLEDLAVSLPGKCFRFRKSDIDAAPQLDFTVPLQSPH